MIWYTPQSSHIKYRNQRLSSILLFHKISYPQFQIYTCIKQNQNWKIKNKKNTKLLLPSSKKFETCKYKSYCEKANTFSPTKSSRRSQNKCSLHIINTSSTAWEAKMHKTSTIWSTWDWERGYWLFSSSSTQPNHLLVTSYYSQSHNS